MFKKPIATPIVQACMFTSLAVLSASIGATTNTELDLAELTQASSAIVTGSVVSSQTQMQGKAAQTLVSVNVTDEIKGETAQTITVVLPGGSYTSGGFRVGETHAGSPQVFTNQQNLYFLSDNNDDGIYNIVGFNQGMITIEPSDKGDTVRGSLTRGQAVSVGEMKARINSVESE